jgi:uncharacterized protein YegL
VRHLLFSALIAALVLGVACTNAQLVSAPTPVEVIDNSFSVSGQFCTGPPDPTLFPVRILFVIDISGSMQISDPAPLGCGGVCLTHRGQAVLDTVNRYPPSSSVSYGVIAFSSTSSILTVDPTTNLPGFTNSADAVKVVLPDLAATNGQTSYDSALMLAYQMLLTDMNQLGTAERSGAKYEIVFMSDGAPDPNTAGPGQSIGPDVALDVQNIEALQTQQQLASVALNTIYVYGGDPPANAIFQASTLLSAMATLGNGQYREFDNNEEFNLFYINFSAFVRTYTLKSFVVSNVTERPVAGPLGIGTIPHADTDGDGLDDETEALVGTSPLLSDTDGDGFSDYLEYQLRNSGFNPLYPDDADCVEASDKEDTDGDGLRNCEERYIGTSLQVDDSDGDGYSDDLEYFNGTNPVIADNMGDLDFDRAPNGFELGNHTDPRRDDAADFSQIAYRYDVQAISPGQPAEDAGTGQACYQFSVNNIGLAPAQPTVPGSDPGGTNTILLRVLTTPSDNPNAPGTYQLACVRPRYVESPLTKSPANGAMTVPLDAFKTPGLTADAGVGFDEHRDCIVPP